MTDERTTTQQSTSRDPYTTDLATSVRTTEHAYTPAGPGGATVAARPVTFLFGVLQR